MASLHQLNLTVNKIRANGRKRKMIGSCCSCCCRGSQKHLSPFEKQMCSSSCCSPSYRTTATAKTTTTTATAKTTTSLLLHKNHNKKKQCCTNTFQKWFVMITILFVPKTTTTTTKKQIFHNTGGFGLLPFFVVTVVEAGGEVGGATTTTIDSSFSPLHKQQMMNGGTSRKFENNNDTKKWFPFQKRLWIFGKESQQQQQDQQQSQKEQEQEQQQVDSTKQLEDSIIIIQSNRKRQNNLQKNHLKTNLTPQNNMIDSMNHHQTTRTTTTTDNMELNHTTIGMDRKVLQKQQENQQTRLLSNHQTRNPFLSLSLSTSPLLLSISSFLRTMMESFHEVILSDPVRLSRYCTSLLQIGIVVYLTRSIWTTLNEVVDEFYQQEKDQQQQSSSSSSSVVEPLYVKPKEVEHLIQFLEKDMAAKNEFGSAPSRSNNNLDEIQKRYMESGSTTFRQQQKQGNNKRKNKRTIKSEQVPLPPLPPLHLLQLTKKLMASGMSLRSKRIIILGPPPPPQTQSLYFGMDDDDDMLLLSDSPPPPITTTTTMEEHEKGSQPKSLYGAENRPSIESLLLQLTRTEAAILHQCLWSSPPSSSSSSSSSSSLSSSIVSINHFNKHLSQRMWNSIAGLQSVKERLMGTLTMIIQQKQPHHDESFDDDDNNNSNVDIRSAYQSLFDSTTLPGQGGNGENGGTSGSSSTHGILLYGPPGCGKTLLVKALANVAQIPCLVVTPSVLLRKYVGETNLHVRNLFTLASKLAPCIICIDELDGLFRERNDQEHEVSRDLKTEFLQWWDGMMTTTTTTTTMAESTSLYGTNFESSSNAYTKSHPILVIAATNRPFDVDSAVLRRLPQSLYVGLPDEQARYDIVEELSRYVPTDPEINIRQIAIETDGYSPSDLKQVLQTAVLTGPLRRGQQDNASTLTTSPYLTTNDIQQALMEVPRTPFTQQYRSQLENFIRPFSATAVVATGEVVVSTGVTTSPSSAAAPGTTMVVPVKSNNHNHSNNNDANTNSLPVVPNPPKSNHYNKLQKLETDVGNFYNTGTIEVDNQTFDTLTDIINQMNEYENYDE